MSTEDINLIISSFNELYLENKSLDKISISDVSEKSGIPFGKIYSYFQGKDQIALEIINRSCNSVFSTFDEETEKDMPLVDKLKIFLSLQLEFLGPDYELINDFIPSLLNPFSPFSYLLEDIRKKYLNFLCEVFSTHFKKKDLLLRLTLPVITRAFMAFNISVLKFWSLDKSEGKKNTLNFIEKGVKNFMIISTLM